MHTVIKELRTERRWSQKKTAKEATISASHLCQIEKGRTTPSEGVLKNLCNVFGITIVEYYQRVAKMNIE